MRLPKNPKKTVKVLYLYLTLPLLLIAIVLGVATWGFVASKKAKPIPEMTKEARDEKPEDSKHESSVEHRIGRHCDEKSDCRIGESCVDGHCRNLLRERRSPEVREAPDDGMDGTGWAAIIAAIMGGLTGLLGAVTQLVVAFLTAREKRRNGRA